jgi:hypothetical protein
MELNVTFAGRKRRMADNVAFSCDGKTEFFGVAHGRSISFYSPDGPKLLSRTHTPFPHIELLSTIADSNVFALVARKSLEVEIWDRCHPTLYYSISARPPIKAIKLRPDVLVVVCESLTLIYNLASNQ